MASGIRGTWGAGGQPVFDACCCERPRRGEHAEPGAECLALSVRLGAGDRRGQARGGAGAAARTAAGRVVRGRGTTERGNATTTPVRRCCQYDKATLPNLLNANDLQAGDLGFEPRLTDPESVVLPLHQSPRDSSVLDRVNQIVRISGFRCKPGWKGEPALGFGFGPGSTFGAWFKSGFQLKGGWGRRPKGNAPRSEASALGAAGCRQLDPSHPTLVTYAVGREGRHAPRATPQ